MQVREDFDVESELDARIEKYTDEQWSDLRILDDLSSLGFKFKDFEYNPEYLKKLIFTADKYGRSEEFEV